MMLFSVLGSTLAALVILPLVLALLRGRKASGLTRSEMNLAVHQDHLRELDADLRAGALDPAQHEKARRELQARLLDDLQQDEEARGSSGGALAAIAATLAIPLLAGGVYFAVGTPEALELGDAAYGLGAREVETAVVQLAARLEREPDDAEGWAALARSYLVLGRLERAVKAYASAVDRLPRDAALLADYAHALALARNHRLQGEPERLLERALEVDPENRKALALAGSAAFERQDYAAAIAHWERLLPLVPQASPSAAALNERLAEARGRTSPPAR